MENLTIVIDNGTGYIKAGFSGSDTPKVVFPTLIGSKIPIILILIFM